MRVVLCELGGGEQLMVDMVHTCKRLNKHFACCFNALNFYFMCRYLNLTLALCIFLCAEVSFVKKNLAQDSGLSEYAGLESAVIQELIDS